MKILKCTRRRTTAVAAVKGVATALKPYTLLRTEPTTTEGKVYNHQHRHYYHRRPPSKRERERERERKCERSNKNL